MHLGVILFILELVRRQRQRYRKAFVNQELERYSERRAREGGGGWASFKQRNGDRTKEETDGKKLYIPKVSSEVPSLHY